ncbi:MAG: cupin domain-containing protein [Proteobacteria bacterium]|nr:cupin domain-containing protein [Pseudomonadota bacterium]
MANAADLIRPLTAQEIDGFPKDVILSLEAPFVDARGAIQPLVDATMESAVMINSAKGTVRANHYHKTDWHYCYVIKGQIEYHHRPHGSEDKPEIVIVDEGELFFTPPMVDHAMVFLKDTIFLTLGRNSRRQEVYEADVERIEMVKAE